MKPRSETPDSRHTERDLAMEKLQNSSKSVQDLNNITQSSLNNSRASLAGNAGKYTASMQQLRSSADSEHSSRATNSESLYGADSYAAQMPNRYQRSKLSSPATGVASSAVDTTTEMLLERSKRLHNRKRDFVNERVVERNPYMKEVIDQERRGSLGYNSHYGHNDAVDDDDDDIEPYSSRTRHNYSRTTYSPANRFPTSRSLGRSYNTHSHHLHHFDEYVPSYLDGARRLPTLTTSTHLPNSLHSNASMLGSSSSDYHYNPYTRSTLGGTAGSRSKYLSDYSRGSPSQHRDSCSLS